VIEANAWATKRASAWWPWPGTDLKTLPPIPSRL